jgi:hypothetical protein
MQHVIKKKKKRGLWPKLAIRHGQATNNCKPLFIERVDVIVEAAPKSRTILKRSIRCRLRAA